MKPILLCCFIIATALSVQAQSADYLVLKNKGKTIRKYYSGDNISFTATSGAFFDGLINKIQGDTLYLQQFVIRYLPTTLGTYIIDTAGSFRYKYHYNQVLGIGQKANKNFNRKGSGAALLGGGAVLVVGSGVVYLADRKKFSLPLLIASAGLATAGYFMAKGKKDNVGMRIGKKYQLVYMNMQNTKPQ